jgi:hypothetical protein
MVRGDIGTAIDCNMRINISTATVLQVKYKKPSGAAGVWTGTLTGTESVRFVTILNSIDEAGYWSIQPYIEMATWKGHGRMQQVMVEDHL